MKEENNVNVLDELNKGCCMGMDAIDFILEKVEVIEFKKLLEKQYQDYEKISEKINEIYKEYSDKDPHETSNMNKAMTWYGIQMKTITDSTISKLAELLLKGTNMGIIEGRKLLNHKETDKKITNLVNEYIKMQEVCVEKLKKYL